MARMLRVWKVWPVGSIVAAWQVAGELFREQWPKDRLVAILAFVGMFAIVVFAGVVLPLMFLYLLIHDSLHALARFLARP